MSSGDGEFENGNNPKTMMRTSRNPAAEEKFLRDFFTSSVNLGSNLSDEEEAALTVLCQRFISFGLTSKETIHSIQSTDETTLELLFSSDDTLQPYHDLFVAYLKRRENMSMERSNDAEDDDAAPAEMEIGCCQM